MNIFNQDNKTYVISTHAREQLFNRGNIDLSISSKRGKFLIKNGELLIETPNFRYIKNGNLFFPCKVVGRNMYLVTTVLLFDTMVKNRFQNILNLYDVNTSQ